MNPNIIFLIGMPGSGKTTWRTKYLESNKDYSVVCADDFIEEMAKKDNITYDESWLAYRNDIPKYVNGKLDELINLNKNIILDMTNLSPNKVLSRFPFGCHKYTKNAIVFPPIKTWEEMEKINNVRPGKTIRKAVWENFLLRYQQLDIAKLDKMFDVVEVIASNE